MEKRILADFAERRTRPRARIAWKNGAIRSRAVFVFRSSYLGSIIGVLWRVANGGQNFRKRPNLISEGNLPQLRLFIFPCITSQRMLNLPFLRKFAYGDIVPYLYRKYIPVCFAQQASRRLSQIFHTSTFSYT